MSDKLVLAPRADQPALPNPWIRLPITVAALVANPFDWGVVPSATPGGDGWESIAAAAGAGRLQVVEPVEIDRLPSFPDLAPKEARLPPWKGRAIQQCHATL